ncbi:MAG TPA: HK97 family phage prohead protease [Rugosimonospora sp.]|nr:HK97 family phage prohead protease [Rugosimonospora sp.]
MAHIGWDALVAKLRAKGARDPEGLARYIGRKKYGHAGFAALQAAGRKAKGRAEFLGTRPFEGRSYVISDLTVRANGDGRTVEAYCAAFNVPAEIQDQDGHYTEIVTPGSFDKTIAENGTRFGVFYNHARTIYGTPADTFSVPIGVPVETPRADAHGVLTVTRYLDNPLADSVLDAVKNKAITAQSFSGRFIQSRRTRAERSGGLPTIHRTEVAMREYGPTPFPAYQQASVVGTRSADVWLADLLRMDRDERADLFARMVALAVPIAAPTVASARESIQVGRAVGPLNLEPTQTSAPAEEPPATPVTEPATEPSATSTVEAGAAEEPPTALRSATHADLIRHIRLSKIQRGM